ncbi:MAG TPA: hypothetical protein VFW73_04660 [Lacipirellulaceae bacterium]|nr:hypothetical protein [Lacipirellulaceae bacterium]
MIGAYRVSCVCALSLAIFAGCNRSGSSTAAVATNGGGAATPDFSHNPIAQVASDFLDAVLKGDTERGKALLTPKAMQQIIANDKKFDPPGVDNPTFRIVGVGTPSDDHAFVQCEFKYAANKGVHTEEMCCELRRVDNQWRVSGIAYGTTPDKPWILSNFETGQDTLIPRNASQVPMSTQPETNSATNRPSPPRTAQESSATTTPGADRR